MIMADLSKKKVVFRAPNSHLVKTKFSRYKDILESLAEFFEVLVFVDAPMGAEDIIPKRDQRAIVFLHLYSFPAGFENTKINKLATIYGYKTPEDAYLMEFKEVDIEKGWSIISPEGLKVGYVCPGNIFIYPAFLDSQLWENNEDINILGLILYSVLTEAVVLDSNSKLYNRPFWSAYNHAKEFLRGRLLKDKYKTLISTEMQSYFTETYDRAFREVKLELDRQREEAKKLAQKDHACQVSIIKVERQIEAAQKAVAERDFGDDFEMILGFERIQCLRVINLASGQHIVVFTDNVEQIPNNISDSHYDIGKFELIINPAKLDKSGISFVQTREQGEFHHMFAQPSSTCFGLILNPIMDKIASAFDIASLTHMCLTFLIKENTTPNKRDSDTAGKDFNDQLGHDFYVSEEDREEQKQAFSELMRKTLLNIYIGKLVPMLPDLSKNLEIIRLERAELRNRILVNQKDFQCLEDVFKVNSDASAVESLLNEPNIFWITASEGQIFIYFNSPHLKGQNYFRANKGLILSISLGEHLRLLDFQGRSLELTNSASNKISSRDEAALIKAKLRCEFSGILKIVQDLIVEGIAKESNFG